MARRAGASFELAPAGAEALVARWRAATGVVWIVKPLTFMNLSGEAVGGLFRYYKLDCGDVLGVAD